MRRNIFTKVKAEFTIKSIKSDVQTKAGLVLSKSRFFKLEIYYLLPVEPKPPAPRAVAESSSASSNTAVM